MKVLKLILLLAIVTSCGRNAGSIVLQKDSNMSQTSLNMEDVHPSNIEREIDSIIERMTLRDKIAQLFIPSIKSEVSSDNFKILKRCADSGVGGIVLLKGQGREAKQIADSLREWSRIAMIIAIDAEWGLGMRLKDMKSYPKNYELAKSWDEIAFMQYGERIASECHSLGINMVLGPVMDLADSGSFLYERSLGNNPDLVSRLSVAYAKGLEKGGIISVGKHFPGHGAALGDTHKGEVGIRKSLYELEMSDLIPFRRYISESLSAIMIGHISFPAIDPDNLPGAFSRVVVTDFLREDLGFEGLVISDALNMAGCGGYRAKDAIKAGVDLLLMPIDIFEEIYAVETAVKNGELFETDIEEHVRRILRYKKLFFMKTHNGVLGNFIKSDV